LTDEVPAVDVAPGTLVVFADLGCPWAHLAVHRLWAARERAGLAERLRFDVRVFPLEIVNEQPTPFKGLQLEVASLLTVEPNAGWELWSADLTTWPVTMLPAMEAVEAAKEQGLEASEHLDVELRRAFFGASRCISLRSVILDVAVGCGRVDADALAEALDDGRARRSMLEGYRSAASVLDGSPHFFLADGTSVHNPGVSFHWEGERGAKQLVIDDDDSSVYDELVLRAAA
jgi:predicted DsbA family dithiol-disulfide isomerase